MLGKLEKQPVDYLDYDINFSEWLVDSDSVESATAVSSVPEELIVSNVMILSPIIKIWVAGGLNGSTYKITVTATTAEGRIKEVDFMIRVRDC